MVSVSVFDQSVGGKLGRSMRARKYHGPSANAPVVKVSSFAASSAAPIMFELAIAAEKSECVSRSNRIVSLSTRSPASMKLGVLSAAPVISVSVGAVDGPGGSGAGMLAIDMDTFPANAAETETTPIIADEHPLAGLYCIRLYSCQ
jgi:hypothetical protein